MRARVVGLVYALMVLGLVASVPGALESGGQSARCGEELESPEKRFSPAAEGERHCETLEEIGRELTEPADALLARQLFGADPGVDPTRFYTRAVADAQAIDTVGEPWQFVGPRNIGGRILDIAVDPTLPDTIYAASASGGLWRSNDAGLRFTPAWPADLPQAVGAVAITPDGVLFAGTGEVGPGGGSLTYGGTGLYRSTDRGVTWKQVGLPASSRIGRIVVDPSNPERIYVAAAGPLYKAGGERGVYLSEDGGDTFTRVLAGDNDTTGAVDIAVDPQSPNVVYAATWDHLRQPSGRRYEGLGSGVYKSIDAGKTWARIGSPMLGPSPALGRIGLAVAGDAAHTVYVIASLNQGRHGFFKSADRGASFALASTDPNLVTSASSFGWWFGRVWVDPVDPLRVFVAGVTLMKSANGGASWTSDAAPHADQHAMAWDPKVPGRVYLGNDGGVYRHAANGMTGAWIFGKDMPWSQPYGLDISERDPTRIVVGLQDNGSNRSFGKANGDWSSYYGGDGERTLIKPTRAPVAANKEILYGCPQYGGSPTGTCGRSTNGGASTQPIGPQVSSRYNWFMPIEFDPEDPNVLYSGGDIVNRSDDEGATFAPISPVLPRGVTSDLNPDYRNFGTITTIAPAGKSTGTIYAGTDDGSLWYTHDSGRTWTRATDADLPTAWITRLEVSRTDPKRAFVTYSGMRSANNAPYVLETTDGGVTWTNIGDGLPAAPLNDVNLIDGAIVVAGEVGVFFRRAGDSTWLRLGSDMPLAPITELRYHRGTDTLFAANFGRGVWKIPAAVLKG